MFPGNSGANMINATHWLGALAGVVGTIGFTETPVRAMIDAAAVKLNIPVTLVALTVEDHDLRGIFINTFPGDTTMSTLEQVQAFDQGGSSRIQR